ncbi:MAG: hypothetical protein WCR42_05640 [bacterium]
MKKYLLFGLFLFLVAISCKESTSVDTSVTYKITVKVEKGIGGKVYFDNSSYDYTSGIETLEKNGGEEVYLKAEPTSGWKFERWTLISKKDTIFSNDVILNFQASEDLTIKALFIDKSIVYNNLFVKITGNGSIKSLPEGINSRNDCSYPFVNGTTVNLTASPDNNWEFDGWTGAITSQNQQITVTMDTIKSITAIFRDKSIPRVKLNISKTGLGTITSVPFGIDCGSICSYNFDKDVMVSIKAVPNNQYEFTRWEGDAIGTNDRIDVTMNSEKNITAIFTKIPTSTLKIVKQGQGNISSIPAGIDCGYVCEYTFKQNTSVHLTATPISGYQFKKWSGDIADNTSPEIDVALNSNKIINAVFEEITPFFIEDFNVDPLTNGWSNVAQSDYKTTLWEIDKSNIFNNSNLYCYTYTALIKKINDDIDFKTQNFTINFYFKNSGCEEYGYDYFRFFIKLYSSDMTVKDFIYYNLYDGSFSFFGSSKSLFVPIEGKVSIKKIGDQITLQYNDGSPLLTYTLSSAENKFVASYISFGFNHFNYHGSSDQYKNICKYYLIDWIKITKLN